MILCLMQCLGLHSLFQNRLLARSVSSYSEIKNVLQDVKGSMLVLLNHLLHFQVSQRLFGQYFSLWPPLGDQTLPSVQCPATHRSHGPCILRASDDASSLRVMFRTQPSPFGDLGMLPLGCQSGFLLLALTGLRVDSGNTPLERILSRRQGIGWPILAAGVCKLGVVVTR